MFDQNDRPSSNAHSSLGGKATAVLYYAAGSKCATELFLRGGSCVGSCRAGFGTRTDVVVGEFDFMSTIWN